jgi:hypothetical protein
MIDWLPLLIPLIVLSIVLLVGFAGCALDSEGAGAGPLILQYPANLETDVQSIDVTYTFELFETDLFHEVKVGNGEASGSLKNDSIDPGGGLIATMASISLDQRAEITCHVIVTTSADPSDPSASGTPHDLAPAELEKASDDHPPFFQLHRKGDSFTVG